MARRCGMMDGMKVLQVLGLAWALALAALLSGCGAPAVSVAQVEQAVSEECSEQMQDKRTGATCLSVELVQQSPAVFVGLIRTSDGWQRGVTATADAGTGKVNIQWGKIERSVP